jgi:hypothetical protein
MVRTPAAALAQRLNYQLCPQLHIQLLLAAEGQVGLLARLMAPTGAIQFLALLFRQEVVRVVRIGLPSVYPVGLGEEEQIGQAAQEPHRKVMPVALV